jgi:hypothetical protein
MTLSDTGKAIGVVAELLKTSLQDTLQNEGVDVIVNVGRPEPPTTKDHASLNLFLYESQFDPNLKNVPLDEGQKPPLWLVLKFLLTAFDEAAESDTSKALEYLGEGIRVLQGLNFLSPSSSSPSYKALKDNPESLKITFNEISYDLLSKIMQGSTEKYRYSVGFEIRPVMIATGEPPSYELLVGVDYTKNAAIREDTGIEIDVFSSIGPSITSISPLKFEAILSPSPPPPEPNLGSILNITGNNLDISDLTVQLGSVELPIISQKVNKIECRVDGNIRGGKIISAGSQPISVIQTLPNNRRRSSNVLIGNLLPSLQSVSYSKDVSDPNNILGNLILTGILLGTDQDDVFVALYQVGKIVKLLTNFTDVTGTRAAFVNGPVIITQGSNVISATFTDDAANGLNSGAELTNFTDASVLQGTQTGIIFSFKSSDVPLGKYRIILVVNGQQAKNSPEVNIN